MGVHQSSWTAAPAVRESPPPQSSGLLLTLLPPPPPPGAYLGLEHERMKKRKRRRKKSRGFPPSLRALRNLFSAPRARTGGLLLELHRHQCLLLSSSLLWGQASEQQRGRTGKLTADLLILQVLVFLPNLPATIYFSNSCSRHSVQAFWLHVVGDTKWSVFLPRTRTLPQIFEQENSHAQNSD